MTLTEKLARERRARLAAERLLEHKQRELFAANEKLALHARALSNQIVEQRQVVRSALSEAETLKGQNTRFLSDLDHAHTAAVMAERRLWDSVETISDGFAVFDSAQTLVAANRSWLASFKHLPQVAPGIAYAEVLRLAFRHGIVDPDGAVESDWVAMLLARWDQDPIEPLVIRLASGPYLRLIDRRARDGDMVCLALDITDSMQREADLREAQESAEAANRAKSAFLANMSHEIRTPMNGVVGMAELICATALTEEQKLYAETIKASGEALLVIINDVLDYSKIEADKLVMHPEAFDLEHCIQGVAMLLQPSVQDKGIELIVDFDLFLPTRFIGDPGRIRQVLTNLMGNAVKFTHSGHVLVRVVGLEQPDGLQQLHITVEDTGIGIPAALLGHIFGEFNQVEDQANRKFEGTGLGLAITKRLVGLMGGAVWVESEPGEGACFGVQLTLPIAEEAAERWSPVTLRRALVADDQPASRRILAQQLETLGLQVTTCRSAAETLAALADRAEVDVILIEQSLPDIDGAALIHRLRDSGQTAPILLLATNPGPARDDPGLMQEVSAVLQKPVLRRDLFTRLQALSVPPPPRGTAEPSAAPAAEDTPLRAMRILAAEDNRTNQLVFRKMIKDCDVDLTFASNGREAVDLFRSSAPDLIFMDISMPEMDGCDAARAIRAIEAGQGGHVPIVALTAHAMDGDETGILAAGIDYYLTKPLRRAAIIDHILAQRPGGIRPVQAPVAQAPVAQAPVAQAAE